jgi:putative tricarboxylic transport membrane protein
MSKWEKIANVINIALGVFIALYSYYYLKLGVMISPGAGFLPFFLGIALIVLGVVWFITTGISRVSASKKSEGDSSCTGDDDLPSETPITGRFPRKLFFGLIIIVVYAWLFERLGYLLSTLFFMLGWQILVEREKWIKTIAITVLAATAMYALYRLFLHVQLPACLWFSLGGI